MPIFITLTEIAGLKEDEERRIYVNATMIEEIIPRKNGGSVVCYAHRLECTKVKEEPGEIMNKIGRASTIETTTTVYTPD